MRIVHVISGIAPSAGGTAMAVTQLAQAQVQAGLNARIVYSFGERADEVERDLRAGGVAVTAIGPTTNPLSRHPEMASTLARLIAEADVVHVHALWEAIQHHACRLASAAGVPYVVTPHGMLDPWSLGQSRWKKKLYLAWRMRGHLQRASLLHFTTAAEQALTQPLKLRAPSVVEPLGIDHRDFNPLPDVGSFRARWAAIGDRRILLCLSRVHHKKGFDLLCPALRQMDRPDLQLVIAGPDHDGYRPQIEAMLAGSPWAERTTFTGMLTGRRRVEALVDADLFVLPSYQENFGVAVIEALAVGCPVVISDRVNIHHVITDEHLGGVVPLDVDRLAEALGTWLDDADRRAAAKARAPQVVRERFNWVRIAERWAGHYAQITAKLKSNDSTASGAPA